MTATVPVDVLQAPLDPSPHFSKIRGPFITQIESRPVSGSSVWTFPGNDTMGLSGG